MVTSPSAAGKKKPAAKASPDAAPGKATAKKSTVAAAPAAKAKPATKKPAATTAKKTGVAKPKSAPVAGKTRVAKPEISESPATKTAATKKTAAVKSKQKPAVSPEDRYRMIATAAYYLAEYRGFAGGYEMEDWITAEMEIDIMIKS